MPVDGANSDGGAARRVCVLGGGGFIGSHLVSALLDRTAVEVEAVDLSFDKLAVASPRLTTVKASVADAAVLERVVASSEVIFSTTALCNPALYNTRPLDVIDASFTHLVPLVQRCAMRGRWLIHLSTCEVYGRGEVDGAGLARPMAEASSDLVLGPVQRERWTYACAKQLLERVIWAHGAHHGLTFTIVRPFNVIGPRMDFLPGVDGEGTPRVLASFMHALLRGAPLPLVDGGCARRAFLYVDDFVEGLLAVLARPAACQGEILNLGAPDNDVSVAELAVELSAAFQRRFPHARLGGTRAVSAAEFYGPGYDDTPQRIPDIARARERLGWAPRTSLLQMLEPIIEDYAARYGAPGAELR